MIASRIRAEARKSLAGKWTNAVLITLIYNIIMFVINLVLGFIPYLGDIVSFIISIPLSYGILVSFIKLKRDEDVNFTGFLTSGFEQFKKTWCIYGNIFLKLLLPIIISIISMFVFIFSANLSILSISSINPKALTSGFSFFSVLSIIVCIVSSIWGSLEALYYSLVYYILYDNPNMSAKEIVEQSKILMKGNRWNLFWLGLTFFGWAILAVLSLNIGFLWLMPYIIISNICFYETLTYNNNINTDVVENENDYNPISEN